MMSVVKTRGKGKRKPTAVPDTTKQVNEMVGTDKSPTNSEVKATGKNEIEKIQALTLTYQKSDTTLTEEQAKQLAEESMDLRVELVFDSWPGKLFLGSITFMMCFGST